MKITTPRLTIRELQPTDNLAWLEIFSSERVAQFLTKMDDIEAINRSINKKIEKYKINQGASLSIVENKSNKVIGNIELKVKDNQAEISYVLNDKFWNKGYCTEAVRAVIEWAFNSFPIEKIVADCIKENTASSHILVDKLGFNFVKEEMQNNIPFLFFELNKLKNF